jgi:uncharacterized protein
MSDDDERRNEARLDEALEETFPASDPPANTPETGTHVGAVPAATPTATPSVAPPADASPGTVTDNRRQHRFEISVDGATSILNYERTSTSLVLVHTEVPPALRGRHIADSLAKAAIDEAHAEHLQIVAVCPFVKSYLKRHAPQSNSPSDSLSSE